MIVVNSTMPEGETAQMLRAALLETVRCARALPLDALHMTAGEAAGILEELLLEFPMTTAAITLPGYVMALRRSIG